MLRRGLVALRPVGFNILFQRSQFADASTGQAPGLGRLSRGLRLLPQHEPARFGGHAGGQIQLPQQNAAGLVGRYGAPEPDALFFDFLLGSTDLPAGNPRIMVQPVPAKQLAISRRRSSNNGSQWRLVRGG